MSISQDCAYQVFGGLLKDRMTAERSHTQLLELQGIPVHSLLIVTLCTKERDVVLRASKNTTHADYFQTSRTHEVVTTAYLPHLDQTGSLTTTVTSPAQSAVCCDLIRCVKGIIQKYLKTRNSGSDSTGSHTQAFRLPWTNQLIIVNIFTAKHWRNKDINITKQSVRIIHASK